LTVAPDLPGDIAVMPLNGQDLIVQSGSYLASELGITVETKWGGARSFFGGEVMVVDFPGPVDIYLQSRSPEALLGWLIPQLPGRNNDG
jgi:uncharacterized protein (AIM24 family)